MATVRNNMPLTETRTYLGDKGKHLAKKVIRFEMDKLVLIEILLLFDFILIDISRLCGVGISLPFRKNVAWGRGECFKHALCCEVQAMRHASATNQPKQSKAKQIPSMSIQVRAWHMPDAYLLCVKLRAAGFGEGFGKEANRFVIGRCIVCRCPAKLGVAWKGEMNAIYLMIIGVPWNESQSGRPQMQ
jgi:hypothetical protein